MAAAYPPSISPAGRTTWQVGMQCKQATSLHTRAVQAVKLAVQLLLYSADASLSCQLHS